MLPTATAAGGPTIIGPYATSAVSAPTLQVNAPLPGEPIKIGLLAPLTGQVQTFGVSAKEGAELAVSEWNANNKGMFGRPVELVVYDSQCSSNVAADAAIKLIDQEGVRFIIGDICSSGSIPVAKIASQKGVQQISPTSTNPSVTVDEQGNVRPFSFRVCYIDPFQGQVMAKFAVERGDKKTAFIMYDKDSDYSGDHPNRQGTKSLLHDRFSLRAVGNQKPPRLQSTGAVFG